MGGYIDMHCHILPAVDDGARSVEEMERMLKTAYDDGIRCMIATPHYHPRRGKEHPDVLLERLKLLRRAAHRIDERFRVYLGTEIYFGQDIPAKLKGRILSMNRREYILVEFSLPIHIRISSRGSSSFR
ncbi:Tyrosine-protein phosphatase YwqE [[Clostridium] hylemonae DSM 15053]|nr:Tyrosine-protein phosphatase YwqE [[Clostridium] hylemonae DSM 15053]